TPTHSSKSSLSLAPGVCVPPARRAARPAGAPAPPPAAEPFDPLAGGFPVPPKPGQHLAPVPRRRPRRERELIVSGGTNTDSDREEGAENA
ncbi:hypothetical protein ACFXA3_33280, partial [Streptomyces sp. NPDC059456]